MQKEIEALQAKGRKMEAAILSLETDRGTTKGILLEKDQELAELRSKNTLLQKTVSFTLSFFSLSSCFYYL